VVTLTLFDNKRIVLNADLIEFVEGTPDTLISLTDGKKVMVKETVEEVVDCIIAYKRLLSEPLQQRQVKAQGASSFIRVEEH
jgi:flagellar protein FlbD